MKNEFGYTDLVNYEEAVCEAMCEMGEMTRSDAQGLADLHECSIAIGFMDERSPESIVEKLFSEVAYNPARFIGGENGHTNHLDAGIFAASGDFDDAEQSNKRKL
jgi:hypothetical protein